MSSKACKRLDGVKSARCRHRKCAAHLERRVVVAPASALLRNCWACLSVDVRMVGAASIRVRRATSCVAATILAMSPPSFEDAGSLKPYRERKSAATASPVLPFEQAAATNSALALQAAALAPAFAFLAPQASNGRFRLAMAVRSARRGAPPPSPPCKL